MDGGELRSLTTDERIARLERTVFWLKVAGFSVLAAFIGLSIPTIREVLGCLLFIVLVGGGVVVFITATICLLDRLFPNAGSKPGCEERQPE